MLSGAPLSKFASTSCFSAGKLMRAYSHILGTDNAKERKYHYMVRIRAPIDRARDAFNWLPVGLYYIPLFESMAGRIDDRHPLVIHRDYWVRGSRM